MTSRTTAKSSDVVIEILTLTLKPGTRDKFHQVYVTESLPLLKKWNIQVVAHGPSQHDENSYYIIRSFKSLDERQKAEDSFYTSDDWREGPMKTILSMIEHDSYIVVTAEILKEWLGNIFIYSKPVDFSAR